MSVYNPAGGTTYNLNSSISSTQTSFTLSSFLEPVTGTPYTMTLLNTDIIYFTIAPKTTSSEFVSATGLTQNADGTCSVTGVTRGLAKKYPFTTDSSYKLPHSGQTQVIMSDAPQVFKKFVSLEDAETISGLKTFPGGGDASAPVSGTVYSAPTNDLEYSSKKYVDTVAGGIAIDNAIVVSGTAGENLTAGWVVYQKTSDGKWYKAKADTTTTFQQLELGIAQATVSSAGAVNILIRGIDSHQSALVAGTAYYMTDAGGLPSATPGTNTVFVGYGTTTAINLLVDFRSIDIPYHKQKLALVGSSGTPSDTNTYVTTDDVSAAAVADKIVRASGTSLPALNGSALTNVNAATVTSATLVGLAAGVTVASNTGEVALFTVSIPGGVLSTTNAVKFTTSVSSFGLASNTNTATFRLKYGGTTLSTTTITANGTSTTKVAGSLNGYIRANASASAQISGFWLGFGIPTFTTQGNTPSVAALITGNTGTATETSSGALNLVLTVQFNASDSNNTIVADSTIVEKVY